MEVAAHSIDGGGHAGSVLSQQISVWCEMRVQSKLSVDVNLHGT